MNAFRQIDVDVLFEEQGIVVVDKPAGLDMDELRGAMLESFEIEHGPSFLGRIDRPTSGLVIAAVQRDALRRVLPAWERGTIEKHYLVVVHGKIRPTGRIDIPLVDRRHRRKRPAKEGAVEEAVKEDALTTFERIESRGDISLVDARLHTGRTHQIRRHMKAIGHPVVGDPRYGHKERDADLGLTLEGLYLHSWRTQHDGTVDILPPLVEAPMPPRMKKLFD